ncbi:MAG: EscN/YscN/HrcN family type III secretion system ATPase, partial [Firmicutes bacterium]|nr:EscN/YscN/HrcN family type III secretion system ATPase [Bacillota bacterium]
AEDLINIGAYVSGSNPRIDEAIKYNEEIINFLKQDIFESSSFQETVERLQNLPK